MYLKYFILNLVLFIFLLKFFLIIFKDRYIFPFRIAEIANFFSNILINSLIAISIFGNELLLNVIVINCCLSFIFFNMLSMINTSSRTKILLDVLSHKEIKLKKYLMKYNSKIILDNRITRLKTNEEIYIKKSRILINNKGIKFLNIVIFIFTLLKKI